MIKKFIDRPVLATVISILLVLLGGISLTRLPLTQFPEIAPPSVMVTAVYPGANAQTVARTVASALEEAINGVENMTYQTSASGNDGSAAVTVYFKLGTDPDQATVNVQNRVAQVTSKLPAEVVQIGVTTTKQQNSTIMYVDLYSENPAYDETFLQNYAKINLLPDLKRVTGVGNVQLFGDKDYSMRVWLNPRQLAAYQLTPAEAMTAIQDQSLDAAPGKFGEGSQEAMEFVVNYRGKFNRPEQYDDIIIRASADGSVLRLKDVARVELGSYTYAGDSRRNGKPNVSFGIIQTAGSNANDIQTEVNKLLEVKAKTFPKGVKYGVPFSTKRQLDESINQVKTTLLEAFVLVFVVVLLFLQDWRSTLVPAIAVPVALTGTFLFMQLFGFSINLLTLFALVLAIGIVVDDAIVVVEAVHAKMSESHLPPREATTSVMGEITGAILSITLVMAAVFVPVGFIEGPTGVFYQQFAFTLAIAIVLSAVNALTLSPALCALLLKDTHGATADGRPLNWRERFAAAFNAGFDSLTARYVRSLRVLVRHKWLSVSGLAVVTAVTVWLVQVTPRGFIPDEDNSFAMFALNMPAGASLPRTNAALVKANRILEKDPAIASVSSMSGFDILSSSASSSAALGLLQLKPTAERGPVQAVDEVLANLNAQLSTVTDGTFFVFANPTVPGFGTVGGLELVLQDRSNGSLQRFSEVANAFSATLMQRPEIGYASVSFRADYPQLELLVDAVKAKQLGVSVRELLGTMQTYYGSAQASDFNRFGKYYRVIVQADVPDRANVASLDGVYVKNEAGRIVPVTSLLQLKRVYGPQTVAHFNLFNAITVNIQPKPGISSGDAIRAVEEVTAQQLPTGFTYEWTGMTREQIASGNQAVVIFGMCLVFVYLLLAAQYESYILPLAVLLSIPTGILGVFVAVLLAGLENNIYVQVGMIMLIGLLAKNAILIVEFALQRRRAGMPLLAAALEAAQLRLRPILMTSLAFVAGLVPLMRATGPSAIGNRSISVGAAGGMVTGVVLGVFIIPVLFVLFQALQEKLSGKIRPAAPRADETLMEVPAPVLAQ
ncbi:efflux RND transporter permease subunit [Hymenobacter aerilatus]|uniref:Efflux RND transporter permease subunit n=1 Tax=Hymenobacter aerilatus TaxID=2932251 RepID=A0A8T9STQ1_9BACT|nr:efflux RND transporter permease subunit [Hymenobacter aerilatus]UOR05542.1 efflux RND transporter permease subunit [Hymenobacter aerilatus]